MLMLPDRRYLIKAYGFPRSKGLAVRLSLAVDLSTIRVTVGDRSDQVLLITNQLCYYLVMHLASPDILYIIRKPVEKDVNATSENSENMGSKGDYEQLDHSDSDDYRLPVTVSSDNYKTYFCNRKQKILKKIYLQKK
ncbi:hypothetical protein TNCV_856591 [Trichonephila clavipes]|nr:hypothetical protein TNCV_856591 [Trichonephila clavipes]